jgi:hypothetical protein
MRNVIDGVMDKLWEFNMWFFHPSSRTECVEEMERDERFKALIKTDPSLAIEFLKVAVEADRKKAHAEQLITGAVAFVSGILFAWFVK